jgi:hypothetical protein
MKPMMPTKPGALLDLVNRYDEPPPVQEYVDTGQAKEPNGALVGRHCLLSYSTMLESWRLMSFAKYCVTSSQLCHPDQSGGSACRSIAAWRDLLF